MASLGGTKLLLAAVLLVSCVVTDLRSRKVPNRLLLASFVFFFVFNFVFEGVSGLWPELGSLAAAIVCTIPLYMIKAIAAGDAKLIMVLALLLPWDISLATVLYSMIWGSVLGLSRALLAGHGKVMANNILHILKGQAPAASQLHKIPFTVAIFFGFATAVSMSRMGVLWM